MQIGATEAALLGAGITAIAGPISAFWIEHATRRRELEARIWEQSRDVYHFVVAAAEDWRDARSEAAAMYARDEPEQLEPDFQARRDQEKARALDIDLRLYAQGKVRVAYADYHQADLQWLRAHMVWFRARNEGTPDASLARATAQQAADVANAKQSELEEAVWKAVHRPKRFKRGPST